MTGKQTGYERSSGNVFSDLGFPKPERELLKAQLTYEVYKIIEDRGLTQTEAAEILGVSQSYVSDLKRNRSGRFSVAKLFEFLVALNVDVEIKLKRRSARSKHPATIRMSAA